MKRVCVLLLLWAATASACGGQSPSSPSSMSTSATIAGVVVGSSSSLSSVASFHPSASTGSGVVVTINGTSLRTTIDANGQFTFTNVPPGTIQMTFSGPGANGSISIDSVQMGEMIQISVTLSANDVEIDSSDREMGNQDQLEGRVQSLPPSTAAGTLVVRNVTVTTNASTTFTVNGSPGSFADLAVGERVHVAGTRSGNTLAATSIDIQNTNAAIPVEVNGDVSAFSGTAASFQFMVDGTLVKGDGNTDFSGNSAFSDLKNGVRVEVRGQQRNGFVYATKLHVSGS